MHLCLVVAQLTVAVEAPHEQHARLGESGSVGAAAHHCDGALAAQMRRIHALRRAVVLTAVQDAKRSSPCPQSSVVRESCRVPLAGGNRKDRCGAKCIHAHGYRAVVGSSYPQLHTSEIYPSSRCRLLSTPHRSRNFTHLSVLGTPPCEECTIMRHACSMVAPAAGHPPQSVIVPTTGQFPLRRFTTTRSATFKPARTQLTNPLCFTSIAMALSHAFAKLGEGGGCAKRRE